MASEKTPRTPPPSIARMRFGPSAPAARSCGVRPSALISSMNRRRLYRRRLPSCAVDVGFCRSDSDMDHLHDRRSFLRAAAAAGVAWAAADLVQIESALAWAQHQVEN